tara:strand:- start:158 stop:370 length:213 start_codon:yes stop_codon:yes gene_type:complete
MSLDVKVHLTPNTLSSKGDFYYTITWKRDPAPRGEENGNCRVCTGRDDFANDRLPEDVLQIVREIRDSKR